MTKPHYISVYHLTGDIDNIHDQDGKPFDAKRYSRMKHGEASSLTSMGREIAELLVAERPDLLTCEESVMLPVPYKHVPPSCYYLSQAVCDYLNETRVANGLSPAHVTKINRMGVEPKDYATFTQEGRQESMSRIGFSLTEPLTDAHVVIIDDVRVTGLAEVTLVEALKDTGFKTLTLAYFAAVDKGLAASPHVEYALNNADFHGLSSVVQYVQADDFVLNIRLLKFSVASDELASVLPVYPTALIKDMLEGSLESGPDFINAYSAGIDTLQKELASRAGADAV